MAVGWFANPAGEKPGTMPFYYACHARCGPPALVSTWEAAKAMTRGVPNSYAKKFHSRETAEEYIAAFLTAGGNSEDIPVEDVAYTDGSVVNGQATFAVYLGARDARNRSGRIQQTSTAAVTSPQAELRGVIEGAKLVRYGGAVCTDSFYAFNAANNPHAHKWAHNAILIRELREAVSRNGVTVRKVKAHSGNPGNDAADGLCRRGHLDRPTLPSPRRSDPQADRLTG